MLAGLSVGASPSAKTTLSWAHDLGSSAKSPRKHVSKSVGTIFLRSSLTGSSGQKRCDLRLMVPKAPDHETRLACSQPIDAVTGHGCEMPGSVHLNPRIGPPGCNSRPGRVHSNHWTTVFDKASYALASTELAWDRGATGCRMPTVGHTSSPSLPPGSLPLT
ncbi:hypothetical protein VTI74DRAFT_9441 [Chaetomium olivicolor]